MPPFPNPTDDAFVAIDFETADHGADSACAVGLVRVEGCGRRRETVLIRPPRRRIVFTLHPRHHLGDGRERAVVRGGVAASSLPMLDGAAFLAAHNAPFDRRVLAACCAAAGLAVPEMPFVCTVQLARRKWGQRPNDLPSVCRRLGIGLIHHDAGSDAEACARIVIAANSGGQMHDRLAGKSASPSADRPV